MKQGETKMGYVCLFCGKEIEPHEVLFHDTMHNPSFFVDEKRYNYLLGCTGDYIFDNGNKFRGLYFRCEEPNTILKADENGFPVTLSACPCNGLTATELLGEVSDPDETAQKSVDTNEVRLNNRVCPHCHCHLPTEFGKIPNYSICLMGGRAAGKTAYLVCMLQQINTQLQACNLGNAVMVKESMDYFKHQMDHYNETGMTLPTPTNARLMPLVLRYANPNMESVFISLYDIAGEGTVDSSNQVNVDYIANHKGIAASNTLMLMLDPNMLCDGEYVRGRVEAGEMTMEEMEHDCCDVDLTTYLSLCSIIKDYINCDHIISVVTKMDLPLTSGDAGMFAGATSLVRRNNVSEMHKGAVNIDTLSAVSQQMSNFINIKLGVGRSGMGVRQMIQRTFGSSKPPLMLGVSTHTLTDKGFVNLYTHDAPKHRILEPFLAILVCCGVVPATSGQQAPAPSGKPTKTGKPPRHGLFGHK